MLAKVLALGACALAAADELKPKNIDIALSAKWPETPIAVEAAEYLAAEQAAAYWGFIEAFEPPSDASDKQMLEAVESAAKGLLSPLGVSVLKVFLAAHVLSPKVEMWRQQALQEEAQHPELAGAAAWVRACGSVRPLTGAADDVAAQLAPLLSEVGGADCASPDANELLPLDHTFGGGPAAGARVVVLYAPVGSAVLKGAHKVLKARAAEDGIVYVHRPLVRAAAGARVQSLQGYGVQLAIKNMEYKAMDDAQAKDLGGIETEGEEEESEESDEHGFFFRTVLSRRPDLGEKLGEFKELLASSEVRAAMKPPCNRHVTAKELLASSEVRAAAPEDPLTAAPAAARPPRDRGSR